MTCSQCKKQKISWAFATFKTRTGERRRRGMCKDCRGRYAHEKFTERQAWRKAYNKRTKTRRQLEALRRRMAAKTYIDAIKAATPCADCKRRYPPICMDFDHIKAKVRSVSGLVSGAYKLALIKEEMARCELVCANCHRVRTKKRKQNLSPAINVRRSYGKDNSIALLTDRHIVTIRADHAAGEPAHRIATRFGLNRRDVHDIVQRRARRRVA